MIYCYKSSCQNGSFIAPPMGNKKPHTTGGQRNGVGENKVREGNGVKLHPKERDKETCILLDYLIIQQKMFTKEMSLFGSSHSLNTN